MFRLGRSLPAAALLLLLLFAGGAAHAVRGADVPPPTAQAVRAANSQSLTGAGSGDAAVATPALVDGRITAVDAKEGRIEIDGRWYRLVEGRTRIYRRSLVLAASALAAGQPVAYALAPTVGAAAVDRDVLAVVHVR